MLSYEFLTDKQPQLIVWRDKQVKVAVVYLNGIQMNGAMVLEEEWEDILIKAKKFKEMATLLVEKIKSLQEKSISDWTKFAEK